MNSVYSNLKFLELSLQMDALFRAAGACFYFHVSNQTAVFEHFVMVWRINFSEIVGLSGTERNSFDPLYRTFFGSVEWIEPFRF